MFALLAALGAAITINAGYVVQHGGLVHAPAIDFRRPVETFASLLRSRRWLVGSALGYGGIVLEVLALTTLPLSAVQAAIGAGLMLVAAFAKGPRGRAAPVAAALAVIALATLYAVAPPLPHARVTPSAPAVLAACALIGSTAALLARWAPGPIGLALASGVLYGATSLSEAVLAPVLTGARPPLAPVLAAIVAGAPLTVAAFLCFQRALQHGRPLAVVTAMMATMDAVAMAAGLILLGDPLAAGPVARTVQLAALALTALSGLLVVGDRLERSSSAGPGVTFLSRTRPPGRTTRQGATGRP